MADKDIRIGVIGTGLIGKKHIAKYADIPGANVVAACDLDAQELAAAAKRFDIPETYSDYHELLARDDIDAVDVCLHNQLHRPVSVDALEAGKDVYCEKPIAATYADGLAMIETARKTGRKLHIQIGTMFSNTTRVAKAMIDQGKLGEIYHGRAYVNLRRTRPYIDGGATAPFVRKDTAGGGALIDWGIYVICQTLYLMANPKPTRISGQVYDRIPMDPRRRAESGYDVEEMGAGFVHLQNGATLDVMAAWALNMDSRSCCSVAGAEGGIVMPPFFAREPMKLIHNDGHLEMTTSVDADKAARRWSILEGQADAYDSPQHHWVRVLQGKVDLLPTAEVALNMILIAEGIYRSAELGREVTADDLLGERT
jgi:predicted dehydrogenase